MVAIGLFGYASYTVTAGEFFGLTWFNANFERQDVSTKLAGWKWEDLHYVQGALLDGRNLRYAGASGAFLAKANLSSSDLTGADLSDADLRQANFERANLYWADLRGADLTGVTGLTQTQLDQARGDSETKLPIATESPRRPSHWSEDVVKSAEHVLIPAGSFEMGCVEGDEECDDDERPLHQVTISKDFEMQVHEVTAAQYNFFAQETGRGLPPLPSLLEASFAPGLAWQNQPMVMVSWEDAQAYCEWDGRRLPSEAEWAHAARGGKKGLMYPNGNELTHNDANFEGTGGRDAFEYTSPAGSFPPNGFGLYDMAGNVWEWTADWYREDYYSESPVEDPTGPETGDFRVVRGGSRFNPPWVLRVSRRTRLGPDNTYGNIGFRCAREVIP